jgi:hypothetical protein
MRKSLLTILTLGAFALVAYDAKADRILVPVTGSQVDAVCNGKSFCEVSCGLNKEYKCDFGCGPKSCSGMCVTCPTGESSHLYGFPGRAHPTRTTAVRAIRTALEKAGASRRNQ